MWTCSGSFFGVSNEEFSITVCKRLGKNYRCWGWKVFSSGRLCQLLGWSDYRHFRGKYTRAFLCSVKYSSCSDKQALSSDAWCNRCSSKISQFTAVQSHVVCESLKSSNCCVVKFRSIKTHLLNDKGFGKKAMKACLLRSAQTLRSRIVQMNLLVVRQDLHNHIGFAYIEFGRIFSSFLNLSSNGFLLCIFFR